MTAEEAAQNAAKQNLRAEAGLIVVKTVFCLTEMVSNAEEKVRMQDEALRAQAAKTAEEAIRTQIDLAAKAFDIPAKLIRVSYGANLAEKWEWRITIRYKMRNPRGRSFFNMDKSGSGETWDACVERLMEWVSDLHAQAKKDLVRWE